MVTRPSVEQPMWETGRTMLWSCRPAAQRAFQAFPSLFTVLYQHPQWCHMASSSYPMSGVCSLTPLSVAALTQTDQAVLFNCFENINNTIRGTTFSQQKNKRASRCFWSSWKFHFLFRKTELGGTQANAHNSKINFGFPIQIKCKRLNLLLLYVNIHRYMPFKRNYCLKLSGLK